MNITIITMMIITIIVWTIIMIISAIKIVTKW